MSSRNCWHKRESRGSYKWAKSTLACTFPLPCANSACNGKAIVKPVCSFLVGICNRSLLLVPCPINAFIPVKGLSGIKVCLFSSWLTIQAGSQILGWGKRGACWRTIYTHTHTHCHLLCLSPCISINIRCTRRKISENRQHLIHMLTWQISNSKAKLLPLWSYPWPESCRRFLIPQPMQSSPYI